MAEEYSAIFWTETEGNRGSRRGCPQSYPPFSAHLSPIRGRSWVQKIHREKGLYLLGMYYLSVLLVRGMGVYAKDERT